MRGVVGDPPAGRRELRGADSPAATTVVTSAELLSSAATTVDDALRFTPGFTLFRRSSSRAANPTTQGVTLRGLSASGASRTLVLADGVPLNDPFGGWVYWSRVPQAAIERIPGSCLEASADLGATPRQTSKGTVRLPPPMPTIAATIPMPPPASV